MDDAAQNEGTLCVTVKQRERVWIGTSVWVSWYRCEKNGAVKFRIRAPKEIQINRESRLAAGSTTQETTHELDASSS
jgi:sRNA-binding carbon storage regulator CsrA